MCWVVRWQSLTRSSSPAIQQYYVAITYVCVYLCCIRYDVMWLSQLEAENGLRDRGAWCLDKPLRADVVFVMRLFVFTTIPNSDHYGICVVFFLWMGTIGWCRSIVIVSWWASSAIPRIDNQFCLNSIQVCDRNIFSTLELWLWRIQPFRNLIKLQFFIKINIYHWQLLQ